jgi:hypothetical protein
MFKESEICVLDPTGYIPGLKKLLPESEYFVFSKEINSGHNLTKDQFYNLYKFNYNDNLMEINNNYKILFLVLSSLNYFSGNSYHSENRIEVKLMKEIEQIVDKNNFEKIILFDVYDYDYDPNFLPFKFKIDICFKRNFNKNKEYKNNVFPFPCQMFVVPCVLNTMINCKVDFTNYNENKINEIFWCGSVYNHRDDYFKVYRDRLGIFSQIRNEIHTHHVRGEQYLDTMKKYKIGLDLIGAGDPNKRTFEILSSDILLFTNINNLNWGFEKEDNFEPETIFENKEDFLIKKHKLLNDREVYKRCLDTQRKLVCKYLNKEYLKNYIITKIFNQ